MDICNATELDPFDHCYDVIIGFVDGSFSIINTNTLFECNYADGSNIGKLARGWYYFEFEELPYIFQVT